MSRRQATLCDKRINEQWSSGKVKTDEPCNKMAVDKCAICQDDHCAEHALHSERGLILKVDSITEAISPGTTIRNTVPFEGNKDTNAIHKIPICKACRTRGGRVLSRALDEAALYFVKVLAGMITADALEEPER